MKRLASPCSHPHRTAAMIRQATSAAPTPCPGFFPSPAVSAAGVFVRMAVCCGLAAASPASWAVWDGAGLAKAPQAFPPRGKFRASFSSALLAIYPSSFNANFLTIASRP